MRTPRQTIALAAVTALAGMLVPRAGAEDSLPQGLRGFSGQVRGIVVAKGGKNTFTFKVGRVLRAWQGNEAEDPELLVGRTVTVGPR